LTQRRWHRRLPSVLPTIVEYLGKYSQEEG
jgi:hypothetical protein